MDAGCPDCRGVLYVSEIGKHGWLSFRCRTGHVFSAQSLLECKEDRLDEALWTALEMLDELVQFYEAFAARERAYGRAPRANAEGRIARAKQHRRILGALIRNDGPEPLLQRTRRAQRD